MRVPVDILQNQKSRTLELVYEDGHHSVFPFEFLRVMSPSAEVQGHTPDEAQLQVGKRDVGIAGLELVGLYALKIVFTDGHDSGLYSWDYFEELDKTQSERWNRYLEELKRAGASRDPDDPANIPFMPKPRSACGHH